MKRDSRHILYGLNEKQFSSKGLWLLVLLFFGSLVAGGILSLISFKLVHYFDPDASSYLASKPYPKYFDRCRWISVLLILPYLFAQSRLTQYRAIGFQPKGLKQFLLWFAVGILMICIVYGFGHGWGAYALKQDWELGSSLLQQADNAFLAAIFISILEEVVFRGLVFRMFYTALKPTAALLVSSFFFAILHFKSPSFAFDALSPSEIGISEMLQVMWQTAAAVLVQFDLTYILSIFLVGIVLHQIFLLTGNLWSSIGTHAGWVFTIKLIGASFVTTKYANLFSGTTKIADGYWVSVVLMGFVILFAYLQSRKKQSSLP